jgi:hypothetical protein
VAPQKPKITAAVVKTLLPYNGVNENGEQDCCYPVPRFRRRNGATKIQTAKGLSVEIFLRPLRKNTTRPLTVWIVETEYKRICLGGFSATFMVKLTDGKYIFGG